MRERVAVFLKGAVIAVALGMIVMGRPPAIAQRQTPVDPTPETQAVQNALVNKDLAAGEVDRITIHNDIADLRRVQNLQENEITALDTNWKAAMGFIAFLQAGGIFLSYKKKSV